MLILGQVWFIPHNLNGLDNQTTTPVYILHAFAICMSHLLNAMYVSRAAAVQLTHKSTFKSLAISAIINTISGTWLPPFGEGSCPYIQVFKYTEIIQFCSRCSIIMFLGCKHVASSVCTTHEPDKCGKLARMIRMACVRQLYQWLTKEVKQGPKRWWDCMLPKTPFSKRCTCWR